MRRQDKFPFNDLRQPARKKAGTAGCAAVFRMAGDMKAGAGQSNTR
jgi:hypothetical protein